MTVRSHTTEGMLTDDFVQRVQRRLVDDRLMSGDASPDPDAIAMAVRAESGGIVDETHMLAVIRALEEELTGAGLLTPLLADPSTTDVVVNAPDEVLVDRGDGWEKTAVTFTDDAAIQRLARRLALDAGARLDDAHPYVDGQLRDGTRLHAVLPPIAASGTCLSLRVLRPLRYDLPALLDAGMFPGPVAEILTAVIDARLAFVISGGTGSGKTTLLGAMIGAMSPDERVVIVEDAEELHPTHPHQVRMVSRSANVEGAGVISLRELVRQALRMRPDRLILGEARGPEVIDMMAALGTGHDGGAGTVHANSAADVPTRLVALAAQGGMASRELHAQLTAALDVIIAVKVVAGMRQVVEIAVVVGESGQYVTVVPVYDRGEIFDEGAEILTARCADRGHSLRLHTSHECSGGYAGGVGGQHSRTSDSRVPGKQR